jgi:hypothetical protein
VKAAGKASRRRGSLVRACVGRQVRETSTRSGTEGTWAERLRSLDREESVTMHLGRDAGTTLD